MLQGNLLPATSCEQVLETPVGPLARVEESPGRLDLPTDESSQPGDQEAPRVLVSPDALSLAPDPEGEAWVMGREFLGRAWIYQVALGDLRLRLRLPLAVDLARGQRGHLSLVAGERAWLFPSGHQLEAI